MAKAKYQDNLEFVQWMKGTFEERIQDNGQYNALGRRNNMNIYLMGEKKIEVKKQGVKENKENGENRVDKMVKSVSSQSSE